MKKAIKIVLAFLMAAMLVACLVACDFGASTNNKEKDKGGAKTEEKVKLETAMDNYKNEDAKKSEMKTELSFSMYMSITDKNKVEKRSFGLGADVDRITDGKETYASGSLYPTDVPDNVKSLIKDLVDSVRDTADGKGILGLSKNTKSQMNDALPYVEFLQSFLFKETNISAAMGIAGETINLKTELVKRVNGRPDEKQAAWYYTSGSSLSDFLGIDVETDTAVRLLSTPVLGNAKYTGTDSESAHVSASGEAKYDIKMEKNGLNAGVLTYVNDLMKLLGDVTSQAQIAAVQKAAKTVVGWITPEAYEIKAKVGTDKLPVSTTTSFGLYIDIPRESLLTTLNELVNANVLKEEVRERIEGITFLLTKFANTRNKENQDNHLAFSIGLTNTETFKYDEASCDMKKLDRDLFIEADVKTEGRVEVTEALGVVLEDAATEAIEKLVETIAGVENVDMEKIVREVLEKLDFSGRVTLSDIRVAVELTLEENGIDRKGEEEPEQGDEEDPTSDPVEKEPSEDEEEGTPEE